MSDETGKTLKIITSMTQREIEEKKHQVEAFINDASNRIEVTPQNENGATCGDGRTTREVGAQRALRQFGGDMDDYTTAIATLRKLGIELTDDHRRRVMNKVIQVTGGAENFYLHTDTHHADETLTANLIERGILPDGSKETPDRCGDFLAKLEDPSAYGLTDYDLRIAIEYTTGNGTLANVPNDVLPGDHGEFAAVQVYGPVSLQTQTEDGTQLFVLTEDLIAKRNVAMVAALQAEFARELSGSSQSQDLATIYSQTKAQHHLTTAQKLAPDLPLFKVTIPDMYNQATVEFVKVIGNL
ncbi:hypothetical protein KC726_05995 [Candidatus Woesebacteria bacterium]|nr:hypothetical protein [Candidatus Woesebacteria bacterium]